MANSKNIVICLDGTGNQIEENLSNVLKLYRMLIKDEEQIVFYDQGVGTLKKTYTWGRWKQMTRQVIGLAFGHGLDRNVLLAYEFIVKHYQEVKIDSQTVYDHIYIFGFSRGAHTARVLAGLIYEIGILRPEQIHLSKAALMAYKQSQKTNISNDLENQTDYEGAGSNFRRIVNPMTGAIQFLGAFDTVSSVFVPNSNGILPPLIREKLPHTSANPAVRHFRHAMAVDERRRMFRLDRWTMGQHFKPNKYSTGQPRDQDAKEVWFSGYHSDVGGGYKRDDSGLSQIPLRWMADEAKSCGLKINARMADYVMGIKSYSTTTKYQYPKPDAAANSHDSMKLFWRLLEFLPKSNRFKEWPKRSSFLRYYLPLCEPRFIEQGENIDPSVHERKRKVKDYNPENVV